MAIDSVVLLLHESMPTIAVSDIAVLLSAPRFSIIQGVASTTTVFRARLYNSGNASPPITAHDVFTGDTVSVGVNPVWSARAVWDNITTFNFPISILINVRWAIRGGVPVY